MGRLQSDSGSADVANLMEQNKVPGPFLAMLIVQFALIIIDRALFLRKFLFGKVVTNECGCELQEKMFE